MRRVLVFGGWDFGDAKAIDEALKPFGRDIAIVHGDCSDADRLAGAWARRNGICEIKIPANFTYYGSPGGPIRNKWLIHWVRPQIAVAFPGGKGTADMAQKLEAAGIQVIRTV